MANVDGEAVAIAWGALVAPSRLPLEQRLHHLYGQLLELIAEHSPDTVAIEEPFVSANVRTAMAIGQARGLALMAVAENGLPWQGYAPRQVKLSITGSGAASKEQVQQAVMLHLSLNEPPTPNDASDALAVALCHLQSVRADAISMR